jgi:hypothetical protein
MAPSIKSENRNVMGYQFLGKMLISTAMLTQAMDDQNRSLGNFWQPSLKIKFDAVMGSVFCFKMFHQ